MEMPILCSRLLPRSSGAYMASMTAGRALKRPGRSRAQAVADLVLAHGQGGKEEAYFLIPYFPVAGNGSQPA